MNCQKILVLRLGAVGDVIRTLPAVKAIKEQHPSSSISWIVEEPSKALLECQPEIDEVILFPRKKWSKGILSLGNIKSTINEVFTFITDLRRHQFDAVLDFHGILKSGILSFLSGSPRTIGYDRRSGKEGNFLFSNTKVKLPEEGISRFQRNFALLRGIGLEVNPVRNSSGPSPRRIGSGHAGGVLNPAAEQRGFISNEAKGFDSKLHIPKEDREYVDSFFKILSVGPRNLLIAVHPGTSQKTYYKRWMPDQYSRLADRLIKEFKANVIITWGPEELELVEGIQKDMKEPSILSPRTESLTQLAEVFRRCDLYIGGDTGPMHIASLMGVPVVVIYGPTDTIVNEPFGKHKKVMKEVGCNPCRKRSCKELTCLKAITVEDVLKATKEILDVTY